MYTKNAELKAGLVVLVALATFLGFLFKASGSKLPWAKTREVWIRFEQGFAAPSKDDPVLMNGVQVGTVKRVWQEEEVRKDERLTNTDRARLKLKPGEPGTAREIYVLAAVAMDPGMKLPGGTTAEIAVSLTGSRELSFLPGREPRDITDEETRKTPIPGRAAGNLADVQRSVQELVEQLSGVVGHLDLVVGDVRDVVRSVKSKVDSIDISGIQGNVLEASQSLKEGLATAKARIDEITAKVSEAASNVKTLTADGSTIVKDASADVKEILANLKEISATLQKTVERLGPKAEAVLDEVAIAVRTANASLAEFSGLGTKVQGIVSGAGVDLDLALKRISETSHNLADMTEDLRSHPWKLANRPEDKEIAFENVRNAMTNYVRATQSIQESLAQVKALEGRGDLGQAERKKLLDALMVRLQADLARYDEAARMFTRLLQSPQVQAPR